MLGTEEHELVPQPGRVTPCQVTLQKALILERDLSHLGAEVTDQRIQHPVL